MSISQHIFSCSQCFAVLSVAPIATDQGTNLHEISVIEDQHMQF